MKTHLGDGVWAERLADGSIRVEWEEACRWITIIIPISTLAALTEFAKENDDEK